MCCCLLLISTLIWYKNLLFLHLIFKIYSWPTASVLLTFLQDAKEGDCLHQTQSIPGTQMRGNTLTHNYVYVTKLVKLIFLWKMRGHGPFVHTGDHPGPCDVCYISNHCKRPRIFIMPTLFFWKLNHRQKEKWSWNISLILSVVIENTILNPESNSTIESLNSSSFLHWFTRLLRAFCTQREAKAFFGCD